MAKKKESRGHWGSRLGFILAAAGSAIGLGNIWKFPYITGENGGGSFVLIYLICIAFVGFPIMIAEIIMGRSTQKSPVGAFEELTSPNSLWVSVGKLAILAGFVILSYYSVVAGWALNYFLMSANDFFHKTAPQQSFQDKETAYMKEVGKILVKEGEKKLPELKKILATQHSSLQPYAAWALFKLGPKAHSATGDLIAQLHNPDEKVRYWTIRALGAIGPKATTAISPLEQILANKNEPALLRYVTALALGNICREEKKVPQTLIEAVIGKIQSSHPKPLPDPHAQVRKAALLSLAKIQNFSSAVIHAFATALQDPDPHVRQTAAKILQKHPLPLSIETQKLLKAASSTKKPITLKSPQEFEHTFLTLAASPDINTFWHLLFMLLTVGIVYQGVQKGIERWSSILMPALFAMLIFLFLYGIVYNPKSFWEGFLFVFKPKDNLKPSSVLEALGHAFFTLSLGMGAILTYGSYLNKEDDIPKSSMWVCLSDTFIALIACLVIFPILFAFGQNPAKGPGLVFITMPMLFAQIPGGLLLAMVFFLLLAFAALTSAISLLEVVVSYFIDELKWDRKKATLISGLAIFLFGLPSAGFFFKNWANIHGMNFLDTMDTFASNWLLPLGGLLVAIFVGWFMDAERRKNEFLEGTTWSWLYPLWLFVLRYIAPLLVFIVLLNKIKILPTAWIDSLFGVEV